MLVIREHQWAALQQSSFDRFVNTMIAILRRRFPQESTVATDQQLRAFVENQIERAAAYKISDRHCVRVYIELAGCYGWYFDTKLGWASSILNRHILSERTKTDWLEEYVIFSEICNGKL